MGIYFMINRNMQHVTPIITRSLMFLAYNILKRPIPNHSLE